MDEANGPEQDVILAGDFSFSADDHGWQLDGYQPLNPPSIPTTITESSSYDNFWIRESATQEYEALIEVYPFDEIMFADDDDAASLAVSDHRPVAAAFRNDMPDDDAEGSWNRVANHRGSSTKRNTRSSGKVRILRVIAHPTNEEAIVLESMSDHPVNLGGWVLGDENHPEHYRIPSTHTIPANGTYTFEKTTFGFGINNSGETLFLTNPSGTTVDTWSN